MQSTCAILSTVVRPAAQYVNKLSHKRRDFRKTFLEHKMCVLSFFTTLPGIHLILRRIERDTIKKCILVCMQSIRYSSQILMNFLDRFSKKIFYKIKFNEHLSSGSRVVPCGQTDRQWDRQSWSLRETNSRFSQFC